MKLNSIDTNRLIRNMSYVMLAIDSGNEGPVVITRFKKQMAVIFPLNYNTQIEAWAIRGIQFKPSDLKRNISRLMRELESGEDFVIVMKPFRIMDKSTVLVPISIAENILGGSIDADDTKFKPLPFTDMSSRSHIRDHRKSIAHEMTQDLYNKIKGDVDGLG